MYILKVENSVVEVRRDIMRMVNRGYMSESKGIEIVKKFAKEKQKVKEGQIYITI